MPVAGYRSVTIHQKYYDALRAIAEQKEISVTELIEKLIDQYSRPYIRAMIDEIAAKERDFKEPYHAFVLDSKIRYYKSTSWVRTEDYVKRMRDPMLGDLADRIRKDDEFNIDKIFIISKDSWCNREVWKWITDWLTFGLFREKQLRIFVLKQITAGRILAGMERDDQKREQYYDMGIYGETRDKPDHETVVGYLQIDSQSRPGEYKRISSCDEAEEVKKAERYFGELKKGAQPIESSEDIEMLRKQPYD